MITLFLYIRVRTVVYLEIFANDADNNKATVDDNLITRQGVSHEGTYIYISIASVPAQAELPSLSKCCHKGHLPNDDNSIQRPETECNLRSWLQLTKPTTASGIGFRRGIRSYSHQVLQPSSESTHLISPTRNDIHV